MEFHYEDLRILVRKTHLAEAQRAKCVNGLPGSLARAGLRPGKPFTVICMVFGQSIYRDY
jgi:hypothetical protein